MEQMACDERLALEAEPAVRLFTWHPPAISLGWKQPRPSWLDAPAWRAEGLACVERPTGGGVAFHGSDLSIAVVVPRRLGLRLDALMRSVCASAAALCERYGVAAVPFLDAAGSGRIAYCLTEVSPYAVCIDGRKTAGFSLRRYPESWLVQGSALIQPIPPALVRAIPPDIATRLAARARSLSDAAQQPISARDAAERWADIWLSNYAALNFAERN